MSDRTIMVTGGARGVGRVIAERLAANGCRLVLHCFHSYAEGKGLVADLRARGVDAHLVRANLARRTDIETMFEEVSQIAPVLDGLVNNAASGRFVDNLDDMTERDLDRALDVNLKGALWCSLAARPLLSGPHPAIVNISSTGAGLVVASYLPVGVSKAALEALTRYLAVELAPDGIRVNTASAGLVEGEIATHFPGYASMRQVIERSTPLGRIARPQELASLTEFFLSQDSDFITGQVLLADGGLSLGSASLRPEPVAVTPPDQPGSPPEVRDSQERSEATDGNAVAIVGAGLMVPGADDVDEFWDVLVRRPELFSDTPGGRWRHENFFSPDKQAQDKTYQPRSAYITTGGPERDGPAGSQPDYTMTWLRAVVGQALADVTVAPDAAVASFIGYTPDGSHHLEESLVVEGFLERLGGGPEERDAVARALAPFYPRWSPDHGRYLPRAVVAEALEGLVPTGSEMVTVDTACSSALYAIDLAVTELVAGRRDVVVCGGSFALAPTNSVLFAKLHGLSPSGQVRPFDKDADGVLFSDGAAAVVLKRERDALADGDTILGFVDACGTSSDGKGKGIYAPNTAGQRLAVNRAYQGSPVGPEDVDWVIAHATGTPAGDESEILALQDAFADVAGPVYVTSNKSLVGHTGWPAGMVSVINALVSFQHGTITAQHRFEQSSDRLALHEGPLVVPREDVRWPRRHDRARRVAVSGFGFGGTNAHLVLSDGSGTRPAGPPVPSASATSAGGDTDEVVIVAWAADFPVSDPSSVRRWLGGDRTAAPAMSFGPEYAWPKGMRPPRIPPRTLRTIDRCQHMAVSCAEQLRVALGGAWEANATSAAVLIGHMGRTRNSALYALRCHLDDLGDSLRRAGLAMEERLSAVRAVVEAEVPPSTEDSFPGIMPNVIPARISNYFGLNGPNMAIDSGFTSSLSALDKANHYLRQDKVDLALVGGSSGDSLPTMSAAASQLRGRPVHAAEGTVLFALMRRSDAERFHLPALASIVEETTPRTVPIDFVDIATATCSPERTYLGAEGAVAALAALLGHQGDFVLSGGELEAPNAAVHLRVHPPIGSRESVTDEAMQLERYTCVWRPDPGIVEAPAVDALPNGCVVVTNVAQEIAPLLDGVPAVVLSSEPARAETSHVVADPSPEQVGALLPASAPLHLRCILDVTRLDTAEKQRRLHDLVFLAAQQVALKAPAGSSVLTVLVGGLSAEGTPAAAVGLFTGLAKSVNLELSGSLVRCVVTTRTTVADALRELIAETSYSPGLPGAWYVRGERRTPQIVKAPPPKGAGAKLAIGDDDIILAVGGARGITAEILKDLTREVRPVVVVVGRKDLKRFGRELDELGGAEVLRDRASFISSWCGSAPGRKVAEANRRFDDLTEAADSLRNLELLRARCGAGRVHYRAADVLDRSLLTEAVSGVLADHGRVDLVLFAAGANRASSLATKTLADFRLVRDLKHAGYLNLRGALTGRLPRTWVNFGSFIGLTGQVGEADYSSGNDFLDSAALAHAAAGQDERTIGWSYWREVGLGASSVMRSFMEKTGQYTPMSTREGVGHFRDELGLGAAPLPLVFHFGDRERSAVAERIPGAIRDAGAVPAGRSAPCRPLPFVNRVRKREEGYCEVEFDCSHARFAILAHHLVRGHPVLPGLFVPEMAAEAAGVVEPDRPVVGFRRLSFERFLRMDGRSSRDDIKRIEARIVTRDSGSTVVHVSVVGSISGPGDRILKERTTHFEIDVILADEYSPAPEWEAWPAGDGIPVPDPYHAIGSEVLLSGPFVTTTDTVVTPRGMRARLALAVGDHTDLLGGFTVPVMTLDGLARVAALDPLGDRWLPLVAPRTIRRIDLYRPLNDIALARLGQTVELYAVPRGIDLRRGGSNRCVASLSNGEMLLEMRDLTGVELAYYDLVDEVFVAPGKLVRVEVTA